MSWTIGLPPGVKVVSRVKACLLDGGIVKISLSEAMIPKGEKSGKVSCWFGAGDHAGQIRVAFAEGELELKPYKKGGALIKVKFEGDASLLNGLTAESQTCEVLSTGAGGFVVRLPQKRVGRPDVVASRSPDNAGASDRLNMVDYLRKNGHKVMYSGQDGFKFNGKATSRVELLGETNRARRAENLRPLMLSEVE